MKRYIIFLNRRFVPEECQIILNGWLKDDRRYMVLFSDFASTDPRLIMIHEIPTEGEGGDLNAK